MNGPNDYYAPPDEPLARECPVCGEEMEDETCECEEKIE